LQKLTALLFENSVHTEKLSFAFEDAVIHINSNAELIITFSQQQHWKRPNAMQIPVGLEFAFTLHLPKLTFCCTTAQFSDDFKILNQKINQIISRVFFVFG